MCDGTFEAGGGNYYGVNDDYINKTSHQARNDEEQSDDSGISTARLLLCLNRAAASKGHNYSYSHPIRAYTRRDSHIEDELISGGMAIPVQRCTSRSDWIPYRHCTIMAKMSNPYKYLRCTPVGPN